MRRTEAELLEELPNVLLDKIVRPNRPMHDGRQKRKRRRGQSYAEGGEWYDPELEDMKPGHVALMICPEHDKESPLAFRFMLGRGLLSPWLYLAVAEEVDVQERKVTWIYFQPKKFTNKPQRTLTAKVAAQAGVWLLVNESQRPDLWDPSEMVLSWVRDKSEKGWTVPVTQYNQAVTIRHIASDSGGSRGRGG